MLHLLRGVGALFIAVALLMLGNGLQGSLIAVRATLEGFGSGLTGLIMSAYYLGFLVSSLITPRLIGSVGHIRVFAAFAAVAAAAILAQALLPVPLFWMIMRFFSGLAFAGLFVAVESWLNQSVTNESRGRLFAVYMMLVSGCLGLGQYLLPTADPRDEALFIVVAMLLCASIIPLALSRSPAPAIQSVGRIGFRALYRASPLGTVACLLVGMAQGTLLSMGGAYATLIGLKSEGVAVFISLPLFAVLLLQFPLGLWSDRTDRRKVIAAAAVVAAAAAVLSLWRQEQSGLYFFAGFALYGGIVMALYGIVIAHANDAIPNEQVLPASARLYLIYAVGSSLGPTVAGVAMGWFGAPAFLAFGALVHVAVAIFALYRMTRRAAITDEEERGHYVPVAPRTTQVATVASLEAAGERDAA